MEKIKIEKVLSWLDEYRNANNSLRLGQAFLNRFFPAIADAALFYEKDDRVALDLIFKNYTE